MLLGETVVQLSKQAVWVSLLFSLVHPHLLLLSWVPAQQYWSSCWASRVTTLHLKFTLSLVPKGLQHARIAILQNSKILVSTRLCKQVSFPEGVQSTQGLFFFFFDPVPQSWAFKSTSEVLIRLNFKDKTSTAFSLDSSLSLSKRTHLSSRDQFFTPRTFREAFDRCLWSLTNIYYSLSLEC